jgi:tetratricopeptide (TPR) repeat protein
LGRFEDALANAMTAVALEDGFVQRLNAAEALSGLGRYDEALQQLDQGRLFDSVTSGAIPLRVFILASLGKMTEARQSVERANSLSPLVRDVLDEYLQGADSAISVARSNARTASARTAAADLLSRLGMWASIAGRPSDAATLMKMALELEKSDPLVHWRAGMTDCRAGNPASARAHFEAFINLDTLRHSPLRPHPLSFGCN